MRPLRSNKKQKQGIYYFYEKRERFPVLLFSRVIKNGDKFTGRGLFFLFFLSSFLKEKCHLIFGDKVSLKRWGGGKGRKEGEEEAWKWPGKNEWMNMWKSRKWCDGGRNEFDELRILIILSFLINENVRINDQSINQSIIC